MKEHEGGASVADLCQKHGVSDASIYNWKARFGGMDVSEAWRLKALEDENTRLARELLSVAAPPDEDTHGEPEDTRPACPCCGGRMFVIEVFERWKQPRGPPDASAPIRETAS